jgi:hypothetical protein
MSVKASSETRPLNEIFQARAAAAAAAPVTVQHQAPYLILPSMSHEQQFVYRQRQRELFNQGLRQEFPVKYMSFHACFLLMIGIVCIALQVVLIANRAPYFYLANGIWAGAAAILLSLYYAFFGESNLTMITFLSIITGLHYSEKTENFDRI